jgi:hypothetical protein
LAYPCAPQFNRVHRLASQPNFSGFIRNLDTPEIHGYQPGFGYRVYTAKAIEMCRPADAPVTNGHLPLSTEPQKPASTQA